MCQETLPTGSMALGICGLGALFKGTGITTTLLGRNHSSEPSMSSAKDDISSMLKAALEGRKRVGGISLSHAFFRD